MNDPELRELVKKSLFALLIAVLFAVPLFFVFKNKLATSDNKTLSYIKKEKTGFIYIVEEKCSKCNTIKKELNKKNIKYKLLNKSKDKDYNAVLKELELEKSSLDTPILIYIKKGKLKSYIVDISKKDLYEYLENYK